MHKLEAGNRIEAVRKATSLGLIEAAGAADSPRPRDVLVYNDAGPAETSELKVPPVKLDRLTVKRDPPHSR
jgi:hypothetical protein